jgi:hypothetical protein
MSYVVPVGKEEVELYNLLLAEHRQPKNLYPPLLVGVKFVAAEPLLTA